MLSLSRPRSAARPAVAVFLAACGAPSEVPAPDALAYGPPAPNPAAYTFADTLAISIRTDMGPMEVVTARSGTAEMDFRRWASHSEVFVRFPDLRGSFRNPMQGSLVVDESDIDGVFTVRVGPAGLVEVTDTPSLSDGMLGIAGPSSMVRPLFVALPGRAVEVGARWVDTVTIVDEGGGTRSEARSIITYVLEGDTVVTGRRLLRIRTTSMDSVQVEGVSGGVDFEERLTGITSGTVLWDPAAQLLVERVETGGLSGRLDLPGTTAPSMAVSARLSRAVSLRP